MSLSCKDLDHMWKRQESFNRNFIDFENLDFYSKQDMTKEYVLHMLSQSSSLLDQIHWKLHHKKDGSVKRDDIVLEIIDVWKYLLSIMLIWDVTPEEFCTVFDEKSSLVEQRYLQEFASIDGRKIVVCDIDGVLGDYPKSFLKFVVNEERKKGRNLDIDFDNVTSLDLYEYLNGKVSSSDLKEYKKIYRESGIIRNEDTIEGAVKFLSELKKRGMYILLLTSRPFDRYKSLYLDTYMWLVSKGLQFDALMYDSKKRDKISKILETSDVEFVVDDDPKMIYNLENLDRLDKIYLVNRSYNKNARFNSGKVKRVNNLNEILSDLDEVIV